MLSDIVRTIEANYKVDFCYDKQPFFFNVQYSMKLFFVFLWALGVDSLAVYQATDLVMLYNPRIKFKTHMCSSFGIRLVLPNR